jgi:hypothetical protein
MISQQQKEVRQGLINLKSKIVKATGGNLLYKPIISKLDGIIKDMETKEFPPEKLASAKSVFTGIATALGRK